jgi:hypothetical protein
MTVCSISRDSDHQVVPSHAADLDIPEHSRTDSTALGSIPHPSPYTLPVIVKTGQYFQEQRTKRSQDALPSSESGRLQKRPAKYAESPASEGPTPMAWRKLATERSSNRRFFGARTSNPATSPLGKSRSNTAGVVESVTRSAWYEAVLATLVLLNAVTIAVETEHRSRWARRVGPEGVSVEWYFVLLADLFCLTFTIDLVLRLLVQRKQFITSSDWRWNLFDIVVVISALVESILNRFVDGQSAFRMLISKSTLLRIIRLLRVVRVTRVGKVLVVFRELRIMVYALCGALKSFVWTCVMLVFVILVFGVLFTEGSLVYSLEAGALDAAATAELQEYFGTLVTSMDSLYMAISGGADWGTMVRPLGLLPAYYRPAFYLYITFTMFAVLNVLTAVFIESTMLHCQQDREFIIQSEMSAKRRFMSTMEEVFDELDSNNSGKISLDELEAHLHEPDVAAYFSALDLDIKRVRKLFTLIDWDRSGGIDREEFTFGCLRLKGAAKSLDLAILDGEVRSIRKTLEERLPLHPRSAIRPEVE